MSVLEIMHGHLHQDNPNAEELFRQLPEVDVQVDDSTTSEVGVTDEKQRSQPATARVVKTFVCDVCP